MASWRAELKKEAWVKFLRDRMRRLKDGASLLFAVYRTIGYKDIIQHFRDERGPDGRWARRAPSTQERYRKIQRGQWSPPKGYPKAVFRPSNKVLSLTGATRKSILNNKAGRRLSNNRIVVFAGTDYSGKLDEGDPMRNLPARPFMWMSDKARRMMSKAVVDIVDGE